MIRSELDVLLDKIQDEALRADLRTQIDRLKERRSYGLVFERHIPERVRLPQREITIGSRVVLRDGPDNPTWEVASIEDGVATLTTYRDAQGAYVQRGEHADVEKAPIDTLVVISEFGEPVLPGLKSVGSIERGGDKPYHVVINGENHHALEALRFTHAGKIDCIYIDPPYNSGARDWKYNNDYVDDNDAYRHSKWLAFMERRLKLAKELLNPDASVLIVTIDEKEYLRLGMLLDQTFSAARIQMISTLINPAYSARAGGFGRSDEYVFLVMLGDSSPSRVRLSREWVSAKGRTHTGNIRWDLLRRSGPGAARRDSPGGFYPIYVDPGTRRVMHVGERLPDGVSTPPEMEGAVAVLPIRQDGTEGRWQATPQTLRDRNEQGRVRVTGSAATGYTISILKDGEYEKVLRGEFEITGRAEDGSLLVADVDTSEVLVIPSTQWRVPSHDATQYGSRLLNNFLPGRRFPFPKSLYAVEDTIRFFVNDKPEAIVLDFFAGSGTTAHAVMRLNHQDAGRRQSIMVTNNEVSVEEAAELHKRGLRPGDPEWEAQGIFQHITRPRVEAAVTGKTPAGEPIKGDYKFTDEFPMAEGFLENVQFLELTYLDADRVDLGQAFDDLRALVWLRAGGRGPVASISDSKGEPLPFVWTDHYGVLFDTDQWRAFVSSRPETARAAFIVTYSAAVFASIASELPAGMDVVRLYDSYLSRFQPDRAAD